MKKVLKTGLFLGFLLISACSGSGKSKDTFVQVNYEEFHQAALKADSLEMPYKSAIFKRYDKNGNDTEVLTTYKLIFENDKWTTYEANRPWYSDKFPERTLNENRACFVPKSEDYSNYEKAELKYFLNRNRGTFLFDEVIYERLSDDSLSYYHSVAYGNKYGYVSGAELYECYRLTNEEEIPTTFDHSTRIEVTFSEEVFPEPTPSPTPTPTPTEMPTPTPTPSVTPTPTPTPSPTFIPTDDLWDHSQDYLRTGTKTLDFYNVNDTHGAVSYYVDDNGSMDPGIAKVATILKNGQASNPDGYVFTSSGDMWQGGVESNLTKGRIMNDWMELMGCSAMALGNHEFDWTIDVIKENEALTSFPLLACNIIYSDTEENVEWATPYTTITRNGVHIGIIGAIGEGITGDIFAPNVEGFTFDDPTAYVVKWSTYLKSNGADIILFLYHDSTNNVTADCIDASDLVFGGHNHQREKSIVSGIPMIESGCNGRYVGHIRMNYNFATEASSCSLYENLYVGESTSDDSDTVNLIESYSDEIEEISGRVVGYSDYGISKYDIPFLYDRYAYKYFKENIDLDDEYEIFCVETNNARSAIPSGNITYGDVYKALPFDNYLCLARIQGSRIYNNLSTYSSARFYLPNSGIETSGSGICDYVIDQNEYYYVLMIDYIALSDYYSSWMEVVETYGDDSLPRNIFATYVHEDYPIL